MKLLVFSHSCVTPVNRQLYVEFQRLTSWQVDLAIPSNWRDEYGRTPGVEAGPEFDGRLIPLPVRRPGNIILHSYAVKLARVIRESDPDVIYVNHEPYAVATAQIYFANRRAGRRPIGCYSCQNILKRYPPPFRWMERRVLQSSSFFCPISSAVDDVFRTKGYKGSSTVVPLAIDLATYHAPPDDVATICRQRMLGDRSERPLVAYVGRLVAEKGLITLLNAWANPALAGCHLVLVGAGPMDSDLRRRADELGIQERVSFVGYVPHIDAPGYLAAADVLALPSETQPNWKEQFGRVILEAMACGTPVVGSDSGEIPVLIRSTGGGRVFKERDADDLARCLAELCGDERLRLELAARGKASVAQHYDLRAVAGRFADTVLASAGVSPGSTGTLQGSA